MKKGLLKEYYSLCPDGVCDISLLNEVERKLKEQGKMILTGKCQHAGARNGNGRIYSKEILEREVKNYQKLIDENRALSETDHPESRPEVSLQNVSHQTLRLWWIGDELWGTFKVLNTPCGKIVENLIKDGIQLGISSRGLGTVKEVNGSSEVQDDFVLIALDLVAEPSTSGAFLSLAESKNLEKKILTKADRLNRLLNEIIK